jgi:hypothetical protein
MRKCVIVVVVYGNDIKKNDDLYVEYIYKDAFNSYTFTGDTIHFIIQNKTKIILIILVLKNK